MKWITRQHLHVDRTASAWLIRTRIDTQAEFVFVPAGTAAETLDGHTFDMAGGEYAHTGGRCTFEALLARHDLRGDPALLEMGRIIRDADVPPSRSRRPEATGLAALMTGFQVSVADDDKKLRLTAPVYDALYAYCKEKMAQQPAARQTPRPQLRYSRRVAAHLAEDD